MKLSFNKLLWSSAIDADIVETCSQIIYGDCNFIFVSVKFSNFNYWTWNREEFNFIDFKWCSDVNFRFSRNRINLNCVVCIYGFYACSTRNTCRTAAVCSCFKCSFWCVNRSYTNLVVLNDVVLFFNYLLFTVQELIHYLDFNP